MRYLYIVLMVSLFSFGRVDVWYSFSGVQYRGAITLSDLLFASVFFLLIFKILMTGTLIKIKLPIGISIPLILFWLTLFFLPLFGIIIYNYQINYISTSLRHLQYFIILPIFMYSYNKIGDRRVILKDFAVILLIAIFLNATYTFLQYLALLKIPGFHQFFPIRITRYGESSDIIRGFGFFRHFSALGVFSSIVAIYFVCLEFYKKKVKLKFPSIYSITAIILALFCLLVSGHRTSMVGLFVVLALFFVFNIHHTIAVFRKVGLVVCIFIVFLVCFPFTPVLNELVYIFDPGRISSMQLRFDSWSKLIGIYLNKFFPFGTLASPSLVIPDVGADSAFVQITLQGGILLLLFFLLLMICAGSICWHKWLTSKDACDKMIFGFTFLFIIFSFTSALTQNLFMAPSFQTVFWSLIGMISVFFSSKNQTASPSQMNRLNSNLSARV